MVRIIKSEWHQVERRYSVDVTRDLIEDVFPDYTEEEINEYYEQLQTGELDIDTFVDDCSDYLDWEWMDEDDWWTDRKGGYEVTYELEDDTE